MKIHILLLIISTFFYTTILTAQKTVWQDIERAISLKVNLAEISAQLEQTKKDAIGNKQYAIVAHSYYDLMQIADLKSEDTAYFKNSFYIDSILKNKQTPLLLQSVMLILKAKRLAGYRFRFSYRTNKNLFWLADEATDYRKLNSKALDSLVNLYFEEAKTISLQLKQEDVKELLWLSSDPLIFLFKPNYTDIIFAEQLHYMDAALASFINNDSDWLLLKPDEFIESQEMPKSINVNLNSMFILYQKWANWHREEPAIFYFIESLSRKYFHDKDKDNVGNNAEYEHYLEELVQSKYDAVKAHGVYQLCLLWYNKGIGYNNDVYGNYNYYSQSDFVKFDISKRYFYVKALNLLSKNIAQLDSFFYLKKNLLVMKRQIESKKLSIRNQDIYLPAEPIVYRLVFKNISSIHLKIVKLPSPYYQTELNKLDLEKLINAEPVNTMLIPLPDEIDFQTHAVKIETEQLPIGYYAILYSDSLIKKNNQHVNFFTINITNIAAVNSESRLFVLNRKNGMPLTKAKVLVKHALKYKGPIVDAPGKTVNASGYAIVKETNIDQTFIVHGADTLQVKVNKSTVSKPDEVFDKEDDELLDYYEDNTKLLLFTDRAIYRPGQTVYFKGILLTRNPVTGEQVVFNKSNLKFSVWQKLFNKEVKAFINVKLKIYVNDPFNKTTDTLFLSPNEFGSLTGKFKISEKAATGDWEFETDNLDIDNRNDGHFKVEEYKRPSFEMKLEKPIGYLQLGDSFFVKVKIKSFAGAMLNNVSIRYDVHASFSYPGNSFGSEKEEHLYKEIAIVDTTIHTNNDGEVSIKVPSGFLNAYQFPNQKFYEVRYKISATAVDASGESHDESIDLRVGNRPVKIDFAMNNIYEKNSLGIISVTAKNEYAGMVKKQLEASIYRIDKKPIPVKDEWGNSDYEINNRQWIYGVKNREEENTIAEKKTLIYHAMFSPNTEKLKLPAELLEAGNYKLELICRENGNIIGEKIKLFSVFDKVNNIYADSTKNFQYSPINTAAKGEKIKWYLGNKEKYIYSIYQAQYFAKTDKGIHPKYNYQLKTEKAGIKEWNFTVPNDAIDQIQLTHLYIFNNKLFKETSTIYVAKAATDEPEIIVEQYRCKLTPGSTETFVVTIKSKKENVAAELLTTMYDASLDKIEKHIWQKPNQQLRYRLNEIWHDDINERNFNSLYDLNNPGIDLKDYGEKNKLLWWLNPLDYAYDELYKSGTKYSQNNNAISFNMLSGRAAGVSIAPNGLNEVVVIGYGTSKKNLTGSVASISIRGIASLSGNNSPLVIIDGVPFTGELSKINLDLITDAIVLNGADATAMYGQRAANGVIVISTKGPFQLPKPEEPPILVRKNFAETAFFLPQVHADAEGYYNISFTIPESVTEWNWKILAHTKQAKFMYAERNIFTQLPMMVQPNMPRFLYQGDIIQLQTRITNLDSATLSGFVNCLVEDAVTGENITASIVTNSKQSFDVNGKSNNNISYQLKIPENLLHPLKIKITAKAGSFSDGEEYTLPILSNKILVAQNIPFTITNSNETTIQRPVVATDAVPYGLGMYINPKSQAALINALPSLAFYPYSCAEQTFNKILAHAIAIKIIQKDTAAQQTMKRLEFQGSESSSPASLPEEISEQTMPWLQLNHQTQIQQQQLLKIFDTLKSKSMVEKYLNDLVALQNSDGGISWFSGGKSDHYISCYLLEGFGKLKNDSLSFFQNQKNTASFKHFLPSLIAFADNRFTSADNYNFSGLFYLYVRTYWLGEFPLTATNSLKADSVLSSAWKTVSNANLWRQAILIITSLSFKGKDDIFYQKAMQQIESIRQLAISDDVAGIRWKDISNADDFDGNDEETIAMLAMAFEAAGDSKNTVNGIIHWLLKTKEQHSWSTTKATATIVDLLYNHQSTVTGTPIEITASVENTNLIVMDNLLKGQLFDFKQLSQFPPNISVKKNNNTSAGGGFNYYYFTANPPAKSHASGVSISKQLFKLNKTGDKWEQHDSSTILKIADKIKTIITIDAPRQLKYVFIDEKRAAALEPAEAESGYEYGGSFSYYKSVRDAGYQFFAEQIPSGITTISYETVVAKEGHFNNGPVSLQCMYQPQTRAYGMGAMLLVNK